MKTFLVVAVLLAGPASAMTMECIVVKKFSPEHVYTDEELRKEAPSVVIEDGQGPAKVSRCSFSRSAGKITCDTYVMDKVEKNDRGNASNDGVETIKKYYLFRSHFDVQVFPDLSFIENSGRGMISFGTCKLKAP